MQYYDGTPPESIRHGSPWPDARFAWVKDQAEVSPGVHLIPVVSDVPGTRELREISIGLRTERGLVIIAGCSHPGIEKILEAARPIEARVACIFGGLHLVLTKEPEVRRITKALHDDWKVDRIAPGHCTGEPAFEALSEVFGDRYLFAGLGERIEIE
jgi:7,8-dihydropterin-6-yl-methyl-4-(beta-D-ribofuranosyl)aminobenzene 5'-phosphate synthase